jgi:2-methylcitrate dehydratase PrpD
VDITRRLAENIVRAASQPLEDHVQSMAQRSLLNVIGTTVGAARDPAVDAVVSLGRSYGGDRTVLVPGRSVRLDPLRAATAIGLAAHLDDFDDTHLATVVHPGAAALAAALAVGVPAGVDGSTLLTAFALGCEVQLRVALAMSPWHYDQGWHITGTCAPLGAAVTAALLHGSSVDVLEQAIAVATGMTLGHREGFGSMIKPFHPGKAATNGVFAAVLAEMGCTGPADALGRAGGYFSVLSPRFEPNVVNDGFGTSWELMSNTFKPYPCGIVSHPAHDAALTLAPQVRARLDEITAIVVHCHPLVEELTGNPQPQTGLQARFSTIHGVAAGLADGQIALPQYADSRVIAEDITRLRSLARLVVEPERERDSARVDLHLRDGRTLTEDVRHARGSLARPLTQRELENKVAGLIEPVLPGRSGTIIDAVMSLPEMNDLAPLMESVRAPEDTAADAEPVGVTA